VEKKYSRGVDNSRGLEHNQNMSIKNAQKLYNAILKDRDRRIKKMVAEGKTLKEIAEKEEISIARVGQILDRLDNE
jgi:DNA-binding CsgD family transcriptional regulator